LALTRTQKEALLEEYTEKLDRSQVMIWSNYRGLKVHQVQELRRQLRQANAEAVVVKNTLMRVALERAGLPYSDEIMDGPCAVTFVYDEIPAATRVVNIYSRDHEEQFQIRGGVVGGKLADVAQVRSLITLPSREVLLARVLGGLQAPMTGLVGTLSAVLRGFLTVLNARAEQLEGQSG
jgi:large subunit ribosomal protein L10